MIPFTSFNFASVIVFIVVFETFATNANSNSKDYYTSLLEIQKLAKVEQKILKGLLDYRIKLEHRLHLANSFVKEYEESLVPVLRQTKLKNKIESETTDRVPFFINDDESEDLNLIAETLSAHPLLSFKIIRRFSKEMPTLLNDMNAANIDAEFSSIMKAFMATVRLPNEEDVTGAANGLLRIQGSYDIPISDFTRGNFGSGIKTETALDSLDIHYIGNVALSSGHYLGAVEWFGEAYKRTTQFQDTSIPVEIVEKILSDAIIKHNEALNNIDPKDLETAPLFPQPLSMNLSDSRPILNRKKAKNCNLRYTENMPDDLVNFETLCKGEILQPESSRKSYTCWYKRDTPSTLISPFKMELHHENPLVIQIYNIISDSSIANLIRRASPWLSRALILGTPDNKNIKSDIRTSTVTWMQEDHVTAKLSKIIEQATGLDAKTGFNAEEIQLQSYGAVGGHYIPHLDVLFDEIHAPHADDYDKARGDRIATLMFYLSDVQKGGGTAFPRLGVVTQAIKGSAVFWYNLKKNGEERDKLTLHGGCPVVYGNKWVANKWIRRNGQVFRRPCGLNRND